MLDHLLTGHQPLMPQCVVWSVCLIRAIGLLVMLSAARQDHAGLWPLLTAAVASAPASCNERTSGDALAHATWLCGAPSCKSQPTNDQAPQVSPVTLCLVGKPSLQALPRLQALQRLTPNKSKTRKVQLFAAEPPLYVVRPSTSTNERTKTQSGLPQHRASIIIILALTASNPFRSPLYARATPTLSACWSASYYQTSATQQSFFTVHAGAPTSIMLPCHQPCRLQQLPPGAQSTSTRRAVHHTVLTTFTAVPPG